MLKRKKNVLNPEYCAPASVFPVSLRFMVVIYHLRTGHVDDVMLVTDCAVCVRGEWSVCVISPVSPCRFVLTTSTPGALQGAGGDGGGGRRPVCGRGSRPACAVAS